MRSLSRQTTSKCRPDTTAYNFYGNKVSFQDFIAQVHAAAKALCAQGVRPGDRVTICMPNTPQAIILFYAVNRMGAVANMIHPLSGEEEIVHYINDSHSVLCLTLRQFYPKFARIRDRLTLKTLLICDVTDGLAGVKKLLYPLTVKQKVSLPKNADILLWRDFISAGKRWKGAYIHHAASGDVAAILYSGGTTGTSKGILLSNLNFNALALQTGTAGDCLHPGHTMLSIMPVFHGFGLGVCIHTVLYWGGTAILIPQFDAKSYCKLLGQYKPNYIAGVPTLFEALLRMEDAQKLRGKTMELYREDISDELIFASELVDVEVYADGACIGKIKEVLDYPGNSVYVVQGEREYLIPAVKEFILSTDLERNQMQVKLLKGMASDED